MKKVSSGLLGDGPLLPSPPERVLRELAVEGRALDLADQQVADEPREPHGDVLELADLLRGNLQTALDTADYACNS